MRENPLLGALEGAGPENLDFVGPKWHLLCLLPFQGPKKSRFLGTPFSMALVMDVARIKSNHFVLRHTNNRYINTYCSEPTRQPILDKNVLYEYGTDTMNLCAKLSERKDNFYV
jgi:hypothetical protein